MNETPTYIKSLLFPMPKKAQSRRAWSIDLETVWLPFFTATNTIGDTAIPYDALGCPLRLAYDRDGSVKFSVNGRPVIKVEKHIADTVRLVRENFTATLVHYAGQVKSAMPDDYKAMVDKCTEAGKPIARADSDNLSKALADKVEEALKAVAPEVKPEVEVEVEGKGKNKGKVLATA